MAAAVSHSDPDIAGWVNVSTLIDDLSSVQVVGLSEAALRTVLRSARHLQAGLDALVCRVGVEADRLADQGRSAPADELFVSGGHVRSSTARREAARPRTVSDIAGLSDAVTSGCVGVDHVDSLAQRLKKLTDDERARVDEAWLVDKAKLLPADRFDRAVKNEIDRAREDHGLKNAAQKRQASEFHHWFDHKSGMGKFSGQLDPERYEALTTAVDQHVNALAADIGEKVRKDGALAATALAELVSATPKRSRNQSHITVIVDHKTLAEGGHNRSVRQTGNGHDVPPETIDRLGCNAILQKSFLTNKTYQSTSDENTGRRPTPNGPPSAPFTPPAAGLTATDQSAGANSTTSTNGKTGEPPTSTT